MSRLSRIQSTPLPPRPPKKGFNPANPEIPILENYRARPGKEFWDVFPVHRNWRSGTPFKLDLDKLESCVKLAGDTEQMRTLLSEISHDVTYGADLKVEDGYEPNAVRFP